MITAAADFSSIISASSKKELRVPTGHTLAEKSFFSTTP
jgi:hypothetical protein